MCGAVAHIYAKRRCRDGWDYLELLSLPLHYSQPGHEVLLSSLPVTPCGGKKDILESFKFFSFYYILLAGYLRGTPYTIISYIDHEHDC